MIRAPDDRGPAVTTERLWSILEHPRGLIDARIGAAVALRASVGRDGLAWLERFARSCVVPAIRRELAAIAARDRLIEATTTRL